MGWSCCVAFVSKNGRRIVVQSFRRIIVLSYRRKIALYRRTLKRWSY